MLFPPYRSKLCGFSLLEMLITMAIIGLITAIVLVKYGSFNNAVLLKSQAFEVALDLREAQTFAISVQGNSNEFRNDYGLYFNKSQPSEYVFFLDDDDVDPAQYDSGEALNTKLIDPRFKISKICVDVTNCGVSQVSVSFKRPNFDAQMYAVGVGEVQQVDIYIANALDTDTTRLVRIYRSGEISVE